MSRHQTPQARWSTKEDLRKSASAEDQFRFSALSNADWRHLEELLTAGRDAYGELKNLCSWVKDNGGMGSLYRSQQELDPEEGQSGLDNGLFWTPRQREAATSIPETRDP